MKPIVLSHRLVDGSRTERAPVIITWDGCVTPEELHGVEPGQYVLLPYDPPPDDPPTPTPLAA